MKRSYQTEKTNSYFSGNSAIVEAEINSSCTVSFINLIDLTQIERLRKASLEQIRPSYTAFIAKAVAMALQDFPYANRRFYRPFGIFPRRFQNFNTVDIAVAAETNLPNREYVAFIDILRAAEKKTISQISDWLFHYRTNIRENKQWQEFEFVMTKLPKLLGRILMGLPVFFPNLWAKYRGGAVLISSPAKYGVDGVVASWPAPLGVSFGLVKERVIAKNGQAVVCPTLNLTLNFDRRLMAGAQAAKFFHRVSEILENWPLEENQVPLTPLNAKNLKA